MGTWKQNIGSTLFVIIGILEFLSGLSQTGLGKNGESPTVTGMTILFGALAFRSAKTRRLRNVPFFSARSIIELSFVAASLASAFLQNDLKYRVATEPVPFVVSIIALCAYIFAATKRWAVK